LSESTMALERLIRLVKWEKYNRRPSSFKLRVSAKTRTPDVAVVRLQEIGTATLQFSTSSPQSGRYGRPCSRSPAVASPMAIRMSVRQLRSRGRLGGRASETCARASRRQGSASKWRRHRPGGEKVAPATGTSGHANSGSVATYGRTDVRTNGEAARPRQAGRRARARRARAVAVYVKTRTASALRRRAMPPGFSLVTSWPVANAGGLKEIVLEAVRTIAHRSDRRPTSRSGSRPFSTPKPSEHEGREAPMTTPRSVSSLPVRSRKGHRHEKDAVRPEAPIEPRTQVAARWFGYWNRPCATEGADDRALRAEDLLGSRDAECSRKSYWMPRE